MNMTDAYADGWNGGTYSITDNNSGTVLGTGGLTSGAAGSDLVSIGAACPVYGCMDSTASNYDPLANKSDESCSYSGECQYDQLVVSMYDTYGDGWNGNSLSIGAHSVTLEHDSETFTTFYGSDTVCVDLSYCNTVTVNGGTWQNEISWSIENLSYDVLLYGDAPFTDTLGACDNGIVGCSDMVASNYDANATSDGECIYTSNWDDSEVLGCDDASATNYNPGAQAFIEWFFTSIY